MKRATIICPNMRSNGTVPRGVEFVLACVWAATAGVVDELARIVFGLTTVALVGACTTKVCGVASPHPLSTIAPADTIAPASIITLAGAIASIQ